jgi:hypothetical protein
MASFYGHIYRRNTTGHTDRAHKQIAVFIGAESPGGLAAAIWASGGEGGFGSHISNEVKRSLCCSNNCPL